MIPLPHPLQVFELPREVPILPLEGVVVFPMMFARIGVSEERGRQLIDDAMGTNRVIAVFHPKIDGDAAPPAFEGGEGEASSDIVEPDALNPVGTLCTVLHSLRMMDGSMKLLLHGLSRVTIDALTSRQPYMRATITVLDEEPVNEHDVEVQAMEKLTVDNLRRAVDLSGLSEELIVAAMNADSPGKLADLVASNVPFKPQDLLPLLEELDHKKRLRRLQRILGQEVHLLEIGSRINDEVREEVDKGQRSYYLQQQIKAIRRELGEADPQEAELDELRRRLEAMDMPEHASRVATREMGRLQNLPPAAAEYGVIRTYLEWILDIPWSASTDDHIDIQRAAEILDEDHYGLESVKERIIEFLSVIRLKGGDLRGPILCLVGPPGVGKTSLGRSIARATGRKFQNFSLGGMRDEAEIRGHRRTYVGAMPGRIVKALKEAETNNPLLMLDEIDKLGSDFRGDPASALLEVLDPEQNHRFTDHYMDMAIDLSRVMFITTANTLDSIPEPLRDRMEIIRIAGYTQLEKREIARRYLVPREMDYNGLTSKDIKIQPTALSAIIEDYTEEAGVRGLQREIARACRKVARKKAEFGSDLERWQSNKNGAKKPAAPGKVTLTTKNLEDYLGQKKTFREAAERMGKPGVAIGLAWTSVGGQIMFIEAARYTGKGELVLTGQLGNVMKESAQASFTWLRSNAASWKLDPMAFENFNYHVHVPAGATPKDGPSAGVAIATALASLISGRPVRDFVAMTGEVTLRGNVLPIGGVKEKCLAAHRAGIKEVFLPHHNERDMDDIPEQVRSGLKFKFFAETGEFLQAALK